MDPHYVLIELDDKTLRDLFALSVFFGRYPKTLMTSKELAEEAYSIADALMKAREVTK